MAEEFDVKSDPGIAIFYEGKIGADRGFRFQTVIARDCTPKDLSALVDKLRIEADRQAAITSLDLILSEIDKEIKTLDNIQKDIKRIAEKNVIDWRERGKLGEPKLTSKEQGSFDNLQASLVAKQNRIKDLQAHAEEARKKIASTEHVQDAAE